MLLFAIHGGKEIRRHPFSDRNCNFSRDPSREPSPNFAAICDTCKKATSIVAAIYTLPRKSAANFAAICDTSRDARFSTRVIYTLSRKSACELKGNLQYFAKRKLKKNTKKSGALLTGLQFWKFTKSPRACRPGCRNNNRYRGG